MGYRKITNWLTYLLVRMLICIIQSLPLRHCQGFSRFMSSVAWQRLRIRRQVIEDNLRHAFPYLSPGQRDRIALDMWSHLCLMVCEIAHTARMVNKFAFLVRVRARRAAVATRTHTHTHTYTRPSCIGYIGYRYRAYRVYIYIYIYI